MYNSIGLQTARGSGTNGYVQRNLAFVHQTKEKVKYKTEEEIMKWDQIAHKKPNQEILDHERKRKIELKCLELHEELEEDGVDEDSIQSKVAELRAELLKKAAEDKQVVNIYEIDEFGRPCVKETHQIAEAQQEKNRSLRAAFGISEHFVEGTSLDPNRKLREKVAKEAAIPKYSLVHTPSPEPEAAVEEPPKVTEESKKSKRKHEKKTKKKSKSKDRGDSDSSESSDRDEVKAKKLKKHSKRSQKSTSPDYVNSKSGRDKSRSSRSPKRSPNRDGDKSSVRESKNKSRLDAKESENHFKSLDKQAPAPAAKDVPRKESEPRRRDDSRDRDRSRSDRRHRDERESRDDRDRSSTKISYSSHREPRESERKSSPLDNRRKESSRDDNSTSKSSDSKPIAFSKSENAPQQTSRDIRAEEEESRNQVKEKMKADLARLDSIIDKLGPRKSKKSRRSSSRSSSSDSSTSSDSDSSRSSDSDSSTSDSESSQSSDSDSSSSDSSSSSSSSSGSSRKSSLRSKRKRSPSIPRRSGSPSFLDRRRITRYKDSKK